MSEESGPTRVISELDEGQALDNKGAIQGCLSLLRGEHGQRLRSGVIWISLTQSTAQLAFAQDNLGRIRGTILLLPTNCLSSVPDGMLDRDALLHDTAISDDRLKDSYLLGFVQDRELGRLWGTPTLRSLDEGSFIIELKNVYQKEVLRDSIVSRYRHLPKWFTKSKVGAIFKFMGGRIIGYRPTEEYEKFLRHFQLELGHQLRMCTEMPTATWVELKKGTGVMIGKGCHDSILAEAAKYRDRRLEYRKVVKRELAKRE